MKHTLAFLLSLTLSAQSQLDLVENFTPTGVGNGIRLNPSGSDVWSAYLGEDPDQSYSLDNTVAGCTEVNCYKNVGSQVTDTIYTIISFTPGASTTFIIDQAVPAFQNNDEVWFRNVVGTGCSGLSIMPSSTNIGTATVVGSTTVITVGNNSIGCTFTSGQFQATCNHGCGQYWQFFPYPYTNPAFGVSRGFFRNYLLSGTWSNTNNRLYYRYMCNGSVPQGGASNPNVQLGNYSSTVNGTFGDQGAHYYMQTDSRIYPSRWIYVLENNQNSHEVSQPGGLRPVVDEGLWNGNGGLWLNNLTRWYFNSSGAAWSGSTCWVADVRAGQINNEPDEWVYTLAVGYSGPIASFPNGRYEANWSGPPGQTVSYQVKYSTTGSLHTSGFNSGTTFGTGTATTTGNDYQQVYLNSTDLPEANDLWLAIRPTIPVNNAFTLGGKTILQLGSSGAFFGAVSGTDMANGDQITVASVGGCTSANGTWNITLTPHQVFSIGGGSLVQVVVVSHNATATTTNPHGLVPGQIVHVYRVDPGVESPNWATTVLTTPTANTFTFTWTLQGDGTYDATHPDSFGAALSIHASEIVSLNGSSGCNSAYTSGGTLVATSNTSNFSEIHIQKIGATPALTGFGISGSLRVSGVTIR